MLLIIWSIYVGNKYAFLSLKGFDLKWESVKNGVIVGADSLKLENILPGDSTVLNLKLSGVNLADAKKAGDEVMVNLHVRMLAPTVWAEAGHEVAACQFELQKRADLPQLTFKKKKNEWTIQETDKLLMLYNKHLRAAFDKATGQMVQLNMAGKEIISHNGGFLYDNHRWIENDLFKEVANGLDAAGTCEVSVDKGIVRKYVSWRFFVCNQHCVYIYAEWSNRHGCTFLSSDCELTSLWIGLPAGFYFDSGRLLCTWSLGKLCRP